MGTHTPTTHSVGVEAKAEGKEHGRGREEEKIYKGIKWNQQVTGAGGGGLGWFGGKRKTGKTDEQSPLAGFVLAGTRDYYSTL